MVSVLPKMLLTTNRCNSVVMSDTYTPTEMLEELADHSQPRSYILDVHYIQRVVDRIDGYALGKVGAQLQELGHARDSHPSRYHARATESTKGLAKGTTGVGKFGRNSHPFDGHNSEGSEAKSRHHSPPPPAVHKHRL